MNLEDIKGRIEGGAYFLSDVGFVAFKDVKWLIAETERLRREVGQRDKAIDQLQKRDGRIKEEGHVCSTSETKLPERLSTEAGGVNHFGLVWAINGILGYLKAKEKEDV